MFKNINHIIVMVSNMDQSVDFYKNVMEFKLKFYSEDWSEFNVGNITFALHSGGRAGQGDEKKPHKDLSGVASISFDVENIEAVL